MASKYTASPWKDSMCDDLIRRFKKGETREEFCAAYNLGEETFSKWLVKKPEFAKAYDIAKSKAYAWYLKVGREHMIEEPDGAKINLGLYNRTMNTRFNLPSQRKLKIKGIAKQKKIQDKMNTLLKAVENGELTSMEATQMTRVIEGVVKINEHSELEERISQIEQAQKIGVGDDEFEEVKE